jgi:hypothetical protein
MEATTFVYQTPGEAPLPRDVFVPVKAPAHRPRQAYTVRVQTAEAVKVARRRGFPVYALTGDVPTRFHYPMRLGPILFTTEAWSKALDTTFPTYLYRDEKAIWDPKFEDLVAMVTRIDPAAGRAMLKRNPKAYDPKRLAVVIAREGPVRWATALRFQEFAPEIPRVGRPELLRVVRAQDRENHG